MDDFYSYINKDWFNNFSLPDDQVRYTSFDSVNHNVKKELVDILEGEVKKGTTLGQLFTKLSTNNIVLSDFDKYFKMINEIVTMDDFIKMCGTFSLFGTSLFFHIGVGRDLKHSDDHIISFAQGGCTLPSPTYYQTHKDEYLNFLTIFCDACDINMEGIYDLENEIVQNLMSLSVKRDIEKRYNILTFEQFAKEFNGINIEKYFESHKKIKNIVIEKILVDDVKFIGKISNILSNKKISILKNYLKYKFMLSFHQLALPTNIGRIIFNFFKKELLGVTKEKSLTDTIISYIDIYMPEQLGQLYLDKHFSQDTRTYVQDLTKLIKMSAKNIISNASWLSNATKELSKEKIDMMVVKIGGPTIPENYSEFDDIIDHNTINMTIDMEIFHTKKNIMKYGEKADRSKWNMSSYSVNAYYSPLNNEIVIPAGILHDPFYSLKNDIYNNLGAIGSVISHEISHGFDDQGRLFDKDGNYRGWWLKEDIDKYNVIIQSIKDQFDAKSILNVNVSGSMTMGENIADFTGMTILTNILNINKSTDEEFQLLYTSYAKLWKQKIRDKEMVKRLKTDVHAPPRLRTNIILSNIDDFHRVFSITKKHKMFIEDKKRFKLWK